MPRWSVAVLVLIAIYVLFFFNLTGTGLIGPDEPRYASIGRDMARTGDWITPRLWGEPWFEKPILLYWMTAAAFRLGIGENLAPRLPVALCSVGFLMFYFLTMRKQFGERAAWFATAVLGTSAGWLGFSFVGVTDLPMTAFFGAAMLLSLNWVRSGERRLLPYAAAALGVAVLAKGLVPLVLAVPLAWSGRRRMLDMLRPAFVLPFLIVAGPWYGAVYAYNGYPFFRQFIIEHHFERFTSNALQHGQPFWYYVPIFAASLFPWTPAVVLLGRRSLYSDSRRVFLLLWVVWGFVFFSAAENKLPGYLLPLLPAAAALVGLALDEERDLKLILASSAILLCLVFPLASMLPDALGEGLSRANVPSFRWYWLTPVAIAAAVWWVESAGRRLLAVGALVAGMVLGAGFLKVSAFPEIDRRATARPLWREIAARRSEACVDGLERNERYGLNYYSVTPLPDCDQEDRALHLRP
jgi:4-amino-4-deoxy-L-arabinose transferase